jgi:hypothetical protein
MTYTAPTVTYCGPVVLSTLGGNRISTEGSVKQPL